MVKLVQILINLEKTLIFLCVKSIIFLVYVLILSIAYKNGILWPVG